jgi:hypothetical protein
MSACTWVKADAFVAFDNVVDMTFFLSF